MKQDRHGFRVYESHEEVKSLREPPTLELMRHEGYRETPYRDSRGNWTVGFGIRLGPESMTEDQVSQVYRNRYLTSGADAPVWAKRAEHTAEMLLHRFKASMAVREHLTERGIAVNDVQHEVLTNMAYNMGSTGLKGFKRMFDRLGSGDVVGAADEIVKSEYGKVQAPGRANELASILRNSQDV